MIGESGDGQERSSLPTRLGDGIESGLESAALSVSGSAKWQLLLQAVPVIGPLLGTFLTAEGQRLAERRVLAWCAELARAVERLGVEKLDATFFESDRGAHLLSRMTRAAADEVDPEKLRLYAALLLAGGVRERAPEALSPEAALAALVELSPEQVRLLRLIAQSTEGGAAWPMQGVEPPSDLAADHEFHLKRIERTGLIAELPTYGRETTVGLYRPTPTLHRLMALLHEGGYVAAEGRGEVDASLVAPATGCTFCGGGVEFRPIPSSSSITVTEDDGSVRHVGMPSRVPLCRRCMADFDAKRRRLAGCWNCRRWGPEGMRCPQCHGPIFSLGSA